MTQDEYDTVINSPETYKGIAKHLRGHEPMALFAWTDQAGTQLDLLIAIPPHQAGHLQRGIRAGDLFVCVCGIGTFAFDINDSEKHPGYVGEKLGLGDTNDTTTALAELINGVIRELLHGN